ncbi:MAG: hypothetical protein KGD60_10225 [Candidatus Thorarchaeota archaeon]|nr:hypothetical protein [Candidatus Thorarchaeota archaeon]
MTVFDWSLHPLAENYLIQIVSGFLENNDAARKISEKMQMETATQFFDWIDHVSLPADRVDSENLIELGFHENEKVAKEKGTKVYALSESTLFPLILTDIKETKLALKPESLDHFLQMNHSYYNWPSVKGPVDYRARSVYDVEGERNGPYRKALVNQQGNYELWAVERRGFDGFKIPRSSGDIEEYLMNLQEFMTRRRKFNQDTEGLQALIENIKLFCRGSSSAKVTDAFFRAERLYWQNRDQGGQIQKAFQDRLGLGWGNHDHHAYRSSRENFHLLIELFETMGFEPREQFFAGPTAGWGAQVLEHPICGITIFADVDITEEERSRDFAHDSMAAISKLGTVGLWVALHGESMLQAGMHHLAARVDFSQARSALEARGIQTLTPFSDFHFLKQLFTESERRHVEPSRLENTLGVGRLTKEQSGLFKNKGAISSHLEIIQRSEGFKGFNQDSVSVIIKETDPRTSGSRNA